MPILSIGTHSYEELMVLIDLAIIFFQKFPELQLSSHIPNVC